MATTRECGLSLPEPVVIGCDFDTAFRPPLAVMKVAWPGAVARAWSLPGQLRLAGPPPARFGVRVQRLGPERYALYLSWDDHAHLWGDLERGQVLLSSLSDLLAALGTDLAYLLDQPLCGGNPACVPDMDLVRAPGRAA
jgi:hypothetical protein